MADTLLASLQREQRERQKRIEERHQLREVEEAITEVHSDHEDQIVGEPDVSEFEEAIPQRTMYEPLSEERATTIVQAHYRSFHTRNGLKTNKRYQKAVKRNRVIKELISTEKTYVTQLQQLKAMYIIPLTTSPREGRKPILTQMEARELFMGIESIASFNAELHSRFERAFKNWGFIQLIGPDFIELAPFLKLYAQYVNNYNQALSAMTRLIKKNGNFRDHVNRLTSEGHDLASFLILPIQRIPRYEMLLKELIKATPSDHVDWNTLNDAYSNVQQIASYVNERKRSAEKLEKMLNAATVISGYDELVQPHRRYLFDEDLGMTPFVADKKDKQVERWFLFSDILIKCKKKGKGRRYESQNVYDMRTVSFKDQMDAGDRKNAIVLDLGKTSLTVYAATPHLKAQWMASIQSAVDALANKNKDDILVWNTVAAAAIDASLTRHDALALAQLRSPAQEPGEAAVLLGIPPSQRAHHTLNTILLPSPTGEGLIERAVCIGGCTNMAKQVASDQVFVYIPESNQWFAPETMGSMPHTYWHATTRIAFPEGDRLFVFGGFDGTARLDGLYSLDPNGWQVTDLGLDRHGLWPSARCAHSMVHVNGGLFVYGGRDGDGKFLDDLWRWDVDTGRWEEIIPIGATPPTMAWHTATAVQNNIVFIGGIGQTGMVADVWSYNTKTRRWTVASTSPTQPDALRAPSRYQHTATLVGSMIVVLFGRSQLQEYFDTHILDVRDMVWSRPRVGPKSLPSARSGHAAVLVEGRILTFGGHTMNPSTPNQHLFNDICLLPVISQLRMAFFQELKTAANDKSKSASARVAMEENLADPGPVTTLKRVTQIKSRQLTKAEAFHKLRERMLKIEEGDEEDDVPSSLEVVGSNPTSPRDRAGSQGPDATTRLALTQQTAKVKELEVQCSILGEEKAALSVELEEERQLKNLLMKRASDDSRQRKSDAAALDRARANLSDMRRENMRLQRMIISLQNIVGKDKKPKDSPTLTVADPGRIAMSDDGVSLPPQKIPPPPPGPLTFTVEAPPNAELMVRFVFRHSMHDALMVGDIAYGRFRQAITERFGPKLAVSYVSTSGEVLFVRNQENLDEAIHVATSDVKKRMNFWISQEKKGGALAKLNIFRGCGTQ